MAITTILYYVYFNSKCAYLEVGVCARLNEIIMNHVIAQTEPNAIIIIILELYK